MIIVENFVDNSSREERRIHLDLSEPCVERGGWSTGYKGVLAQYLNTTIPFGPKYPLCHACHNGKCSNPKHIYWGNKSDNTLDAIENGNAFGGKDVVRVFKNYIWITDDLNNKKILLESDIPAGYKKGMSIKESNNKKGINGFTTGTQIKGQVKYKDKNGNMLPIPRPGSKGRFWVTDGRKNMLINKEGIVPEGFVKGRTI